MFFWTFLNCWVRDVFPHINALFNGKHTRSFIFLFILFIHLFFLKSSVFVVFVNSTFLTFTFVMVGEKSFYLIIFFETHSTNVGLPITLFNLNLFTHHTDSNTMCSNITKLLIQANYAAFLFVFQLQVKHSSIETSSL